MLERSESFGRLAFKEIGESQVRMYFRNFRREASKMLQRLNCFAPLLCIERPARIVGIAINVGFPLVSNRERSERK
jgi:hypothetical protein